MFTLIYVEKPFSHYVPQISHYLKELKMGLFAVADEINSFAKEHKMDSVRQLETYSSSDYSILSKDD